MKHLSMGTVKHDFEPLPTALELIFRNWYAQHRKDIEAMALQAAIDQAIAAFTDEWMKAHRM